MFTVADEATLQDLVREAKAIEATFRQRVRTVLAIVVLGLLPLAQPR